MGGVRGFQLLAWSSMTSRSSDRVSIDSEGHSILSRALARSSVIISGSCSSSNRPVLCSCGQRRGCQDRPWDPQWSPDPPWLGEWGAGTRNSCMVSGRCRPGLGDTGRGSTETADSESPHLTANGWQEPEGSECCPGLKSPHQEHSTLPFSHQLSLLQEAFSDYRPHPQGV